MKTVDFNKNFTNLRGEEMSEKMVDTIAEMLYAAGSNNLNVSPDDKFRAYKISTKLITNDGIVELDDADMTVIQNVCSVTLVAGAYGQIVDLLNN